MTKVIDYAWSSGFANAAAIKAAGFAGVQRYLSHDNSKDLTAAERDDLRAQDMSIGLVWESTANRAGQGFDAGVQDAKAANAAADALGYPGDCTLWYAVDFDGSVAQVQPYFDGVASAGGRPHAPYGGFKVIDGVNYPGAGWQTVAWSGGKVSKRAGLIQNGFKQSYDSNDVLNAAYGAWGAHTTGDLSMADAASLDKHLADVNDFLGTRLSETRNALEARFDILGALVGDITKHLPTDGSTVDVDKLAAAIVKTLAPAEAKALIAALGQKLSG